MIITIVCILLFLGLLFCILYDKTKSKWIKRILFVLMINLCIIATFCLLRALFMLNDNEITEVDNQYVYYYSSAFIQKLTIPVKDIKFVGYTEEDNSIVIIYGAGIKKHFHNSKDIENFLQIFKEKNLLTNYEKDS